MRVSWITTVSPSVTLARPTIGSTLRERAAALKATAGRVLRRPLDLPAPSTDAGRAAFAAACRDHTHLAEPEGAEPDAALIALGLALEASERRERAEEIKGNAATDAAARRAADARIDAACAETAAILERLAAMPAHTAEGLRVKLRAIRHGIVAVDGSTTSCRVFRSLLRDAGVSETDLAAAAEV